MKYRQNDYQGTSIPRWGCYFLSIIFIASVATGVKLSTKQVYDLYWWALQTRGRYGPNVIQIKGTTMWINDAGKLFQEALNSCAPGWVGDFVGNEDGFFVDTNWYKGIRTHEWTGIALHWKRPDYVAPDGVTKQRGHYTGLVPLKDAAMNPDASLGLVAPTGKYSLFYAREVA